MAMIPQKQRISLDAALMAVRWKAIFADELQRVAQRVAGDSDTVSVEHYERALPEAIETLIDNAQNESLLHMPQEWSPKSF